MEYRIGIDLGGTNVVVGVVDENKKVIARANTKTQPNRMLDDIVHDIVECVQTAARKAGIAVTDCVSVGIGAPGFCKSDEGLVVFANNLGWRNVPICDELRQELGCPVHLSNDANCAAFGEAIAGAAKGLHNVVMITIGTGLGSGIIVDGKILEGSVGAAAELGHTVLVMDGEPCSCGRRGCFEAYASASALLKQRHRAELEHPETTMKRFVPEDARAPFLSAKEGDPTAIAVRDQYIRYLGEGICSAICIFAPEVVLLGGGVSNAGDELIVPLNRHIQQEHFGGRRIPACEVKKAALGGDAGVIGAAFLGTVL